LFAELSILRHDFIAELGLQNYQFHKTPKFINADGQRLSIEPERSIVFNNFKAATGVKTALTSALAGFHIVEKSDIGFRYPTAALSGKDAPYIKRFRSEYFHKVNEDREICRPMNLSYGIKSRGKSDNREEYEVWVEDEILHLNPSSLFIERYGEDLPASVLNFIAKEPVVHGWMGVKRCAFEAVYHNKAELGDIVICLALSLDAYNIGAKPDLSFSTLSKSSIAQHGAEFEWEVLGYFAPKDSVISHDQIWDAINFTINLLSTPLQTSFSQNIISSTESKTERILSAIEQANVTSDEIMALNLKPWEFLQTQSFTRKKAHDETRTVNLLGRLNRLFYNPDNPLPSLKELHYLAALER
jgi:hypothetical protein